jgi:hypothetical protein
MAFPLEGTMTQWLDEAIAEATALLSLLEEMRRLAEPEKEEDHD